MPNNLRILSKNVSINKLQNIITINQFLYQIRDQYLEMNESNFNYGSALNVFGKE